MLFRPPITIHMMHTTCVVMYLVNIVEGFSLANKAKTYYSLEKVRILTKDSLHLFSKVLI